MLLYQWANSTSQNFAPDTNLDEVLRTTDSPAEPKRVFDEAESYGMYKVVVWELWWESPSYTHLIIVELYTRDELSRAFPKDHSRCGYTDVGRDEHAEGMQ